MRLQKKRQWAWCCGTRFRRFTGRGCHYARQVHSCPQCGKELRFGTLARHTPPVVFGAGENSAALEKWNPIEKKLAASIRRSIAAHFRADAVWQADLAAKFERGELQSRRGKPAG